MLKKLFIANAIFATVGGLGLLFSADQLMTPYGLPLNEGGIFLSRLMGGMLLGVALISWLGRTLKDKESIKILSLGFIVIHGISAVIGILYSLNGAIAPMIWVDIVIHGAFALLFYQSGFQKNK